MAGGPASPAPPSERSGGDRLVLVGRVAGAFGVRGEVRIVAYTAEPLALLGYRVLLREDGSPVLTLASARPAKANEIVARADGVADKDAADALKGLRLHVPRSALPPPDEDDFYITDLIGLSAFDPEGRPLGRIRAMHDFGAGDVLEVDPGGGRATWMLAFTRETAPEVDVEGGRIVLVRPPEIHGDTP